MILKQSQPSSDIFSDKFQAVLDPQKRSSPATDLQPGALDQRPSTAVLPLECNTKQNQVYNVTLDIETSIAELDRLHQLFSYTNNPNQGSQTISPLEKDEYPTAFDYRYARDDDKITLQRLESCLVAKYPQITNESVWETLETAGGLISYRAACPQCDDADETSEMETDYGSDL